MNIANCKPELENLEACFKACHEAGYPQDIAESCTNGMLQCRNCPWHIKDNSEDI